MNAPLHPALDAAPDVAPALVKLLVPRDAWPLVADALRGAVARGDARWSVRRTAAWVVLPLGSSRLHACRELLDDAGVPLLEVDPAERQCEGCGCVGALGCAHGCRWVGLTRCSACSEHATGPRRRIAKALVRGRRGRR